MTRTRFDRILGPPPAKDTSVFKTYLVEGSLYRYEGKTYMYAYLGQTGKAIIHPPGEPDMQSSLAVDPKDLEGPL